MNFDDGVFGEAASGVTAGCTGFGSGDPSTRISATEAAGGTGGAAGAGAAAGAGSILGSAAGASTFSTAFWRRFGGFWRRARGATATARRRVRKARPEMKSTSASAVSRK